ncbi:ABC transporter permease [Hamadaea tsunoensis]|uniref:ABC transporter permease n=1 Tax=Hamadaea tsunoensis TaxID=53368 RepID=UPI000401DF1F|nr:ABC transporter permease [Hamadaea tsunoensis]
MIVTEWLKLRSVRSTWLLLGAGYLLVIAGVSGLLARRTGDGAGLVPKAVGHVGLIGTLSLLLGVRVMAGEYRHKTISETYLAEPRRLRVLAAKVTVAAGLAAAYALTAALVALATTAVWLGDVPFSADLWRTLAGAVAWNVLFAVVGVAVGALLRNLVGAVAVVLAWIAVVEGIAAQLLGDSLAKWLPFQAAMALGDMGAGGLPQAGAGLLLVAYAAVFGGAAVLVTRRADVEG